MSTLWEWHSFCRHAWLWYRSCEATGMVSQKLPIKPCLFSIDWSARNLKDGLVFSLFGYGYIVLRSTVPLNQSLSLWSIGPRGWFMWPSWLNLRREGPREQKTNIGNKSISYHKQINKAHNKRTRPRIMCGNLVIKIADIFRKG